MPFDFKSYTLTCQNLSTAQLQEEWGNYTRQISVGTAVSILGAPFSLGISLVNLAFTCPRIDNARHKRAIIEAILVSRGETHHTRKRDVLVPVAWSTGLGAATFGLAPVAAEAITDAAVAGCVAVVAGNPHFVAGATGLVLDAVNDGIEVDEDRRKKRSEAKTSS